MAVTALVYSPAEWKEKEEEKVVPGKAVEFTEAEGDPPVGKATTVFYVGDPWFTEAYVEDIVTGALVRWECEVVSELDEPGIWRMTAASPAPLKDVQPGLITVQETGAL
jgi:hypothetical protein